MIKRPCRYSILLLVAAALSGCRHQPGESGGVAAKDALATFTVANGFQIEMVASEPLLSSPVDMEIDEYGRMYIVEMHGYPLDKSGSGRIMMLTDENGDGIMDRNTVFKSGLVLPTSIMRWKKGLLVTDAPNVLYLEDSDGDGKAERTDTLLTGFAQTNPQHCVNTPVYGIDNWIYLAHQGAVATREYKQEFGDDGSEIVYPGLPNGPKLPKNAGGVSVRFRPDQQLLEQTSTSSQFGQTFDAWGHRFECNNSNQGYQEMIARRYFARNPAMPVSRAIQNMSDHLDAAEVFPTTLHPDRQLLTNVGVMTSACGLTTYMGGLFPAPYNTGKVTFIAESVSNLAHADLLRDSGTSYAAGRVLEHAEFLSSTDAWCRPVNFYVGPDGALYVCDYYRQVIESPEWMSAEAIAAGGLYNGNDKGRIYRITPKGTPPLNWSKRLQLGNATTEELVAYLADRNYWWRINAQRLLVDKADPKAIPSLIRMTANGGSDMGRLHAMWTLEGLKALTPDLIKTALKDTVAGIRENAIQLAELHLSRDKTLAGALLALRNDPDPKVRLQLLLTLGYVNSPAAAAARNQLLFRAIDDKWVQIAALSAASTQTAPLLNAVLERFKPDVPAYSSMVERLTAMVGASGLPDEVYGLIRRATKPGTAEQATRQAPLLDGLSQGLKTRKPPIDLPVIYQQLLIRTCFAGSSPEILNAAFHVLKVTGIPDTALAKRSIAGALAMINDKSRPDAVRAQAADFLSLGDPTQYADQLKVLLIPQEQPIVQLAALRTLDLVPGTAISQYLIAQWPILTKEIRDPAITLFMHKPERINLLLTAIETGKIKSSGVSFNSSVSLMQQADSNLRNRARVIFTRNKEEAKKVNQQYQQALALPGNTVNGKQVYMANCAICHQVRGKFGVAFGPDLGTIHNWTKEDIMANVLDPNLSISSGFDLWNVELKTGETVQGVIVSETPAAFTLRNNGKMDRTINRQEVKSLQSASISPMPTGLEKNISQQEMADLLAFLRQN